MITFAARRLAAAILTAWVASLLAFFMFWAIPNVDPSFWLGGGRQGTEKTRERASEKWGLNDSLPTQYVRVMRGILSGDLKCFYSCSSMRDEFLRALPVTASLVVGAAVIAIALGVWLALICVRHRGRWPDRLITAIAAATYSVPSIVLSALLWSVVAHKWHVFPEEGYVALKEDPYQWTRHLILPWSAAALPFVGAYVQILRASLLSAAGEEWVRTARAKGLSERKVMRRHVLRNALIPQVNIWGLDFSHAFGGFALYVEVIFGLPAWGP
jgi:peptide/nickel transport system permease protein